MCSLPYLLSIQSENRNRNGLAYSLSVKSSTYIFMVKETYRSAHLLFAQGWKIRSELYFHPVA